MVADAKNNKHRMARAPRCEAPRTTRVAVGDEGAKSPHPPQLFSSLKVRRFCMNSKTQALLFLMKVWYSGICSRRVELSEDVWLRWIGRSRANGCRCEE